MKCEFDKVPFVSNADKVRETCDSVNAGVGVQIDGVKYVVCLNHAVYLFCADTEQEFTYGTANAGECHVVS